MKKHTLKAFFVFGCLLFAISLKAQSNRRVHVPDPAASARLASATHKFDKQAAMIRINKMKEEAQMMRQRDLQIAQQEQQMLRAAQSLPVNPRPVQATPVQPKPVQPKPVPVSNR